MTVEVFKPVIFRGNKIDGYEISNRGRVKSLERKIEYWTTNQTGKRFKYTRFQKENVLKKRLDKGGYEVVVLSTKGKMITAKVHRLVAEAFLKNPYKFKTVNHKDENKINNNVENLEWCTVAYNNSYGSRAEKYKHIKVYDKEKLIYDFNSLRSASKFLGVDRKTILKFVNNSPQVFRAGGKNTQYKHLLFELC